MLRCTRTSLASSIRQLSTQSSSPLVPTSTTSTSKLLQDLSRLLEQYPLLDNKWLNRLHSAIADLEIQRPANISIVGDRDASVQGVTSSILDDPLVNDQDVTVALEARRLTKHSPEAIQLQFGQNVEKSSPDRLVLPAKWLNDNNTSLTEIVHGDIPPLESSFSTLHLSDAVIVILSSESLLSSKASQELLLSLHTKPNLIVCLNTPDASSSSSASLLKTLRHQLDTLFPSSSTSTSHHNQPIIMALSTTQALEALSALTPSDSTATKPIYEDFQLGYLASQIPKLKAALTTFLSSHNTSTTSPTPLQEQTALYMLSTILSHAAFTGASIGDTLSSARSSLLALSSQTSESSSKLLSSLGLASPETLFPIPQEDLDESLSSLQEVFKTRLQFYKLLVGKIDDISSELSLVASQTYLINFEKRLLYTTALFNTHQSRLASQLSQTLSQPPFSSSSSQHPLSSLSSATIQNQLSQSSHPSPTSPSYLSPTALSSPILSRRAQLLHPTSSPISTLHRLTQKALISSLTLSAASIASSVGLNLVHGLDLASSVGLGVLGTTFAVWRLQGKWNKYQKKFLKDVERLNGGVQEDLTVATRELVKRSEWTTRLAVKLYEEKLNEKERGFEAFRGELRRIDQARRGLIVGDVKEVVVEEKNE
ncbi:hypothetical protein JCM5353_006304 [Sporobolomyces roseus]